MDRERERESKHRVEGAGIRDKGREGILSKPPADYGA